MEKELRTLRKQQASGALGWIPVSVRLPEEMIDPDTGEFMEYLVTDQYEEGANIQRLQFGHGHWLMNDVIMDEHVTAWMPLPKPYEKEKNNAENED
jgi:hypothetical protein